MSRLTLQKPMFTNCASSSSTSDGHLGSVRSASDSSMTSRCRRQSWCHCSSPRSRLVSAVLRTPMSSRSPTFWWRRNALSGMCCSSCSLSPARRSSCSPYWSPPLTRLTSNTAATFGNILITRISEQISLMLTQYIFG